MDWTTGLEHWSGILERIKFDPHLRVGSYLFDRKPAITLKMNTVQNIHTVLVHAYAGAVLERSKRKLLRYNFIVKGCGYSFRIGTQVCITHNHLLDGI